MAESEEELMRLLMKVKEESEKVGLKLNSGHGTGKGQFSFQSPKMAMSKNSQTTYHKIALISCLQSNAQNSLRQASTVHEMGTSRCSSWF